MTSTGTKKKCDLVSLELSRNLVIYYDYYDNP